MTLESSRAVAQTAYDLLVCGSLNLDLVSQVPYLPTPGETLAAQSLSRLPGGKGLNQAVAAARQGVRVALLGAIGEDAAGRELREVLAREHIADRAVLSLPDIPTGLALIHVAGNAENVIVIHGGANSVLTPDTVRDHCAPAKVYLAQLEVPLACVHEFFARAKEQGAVRILNAAPAVPAAVSLLNAIDVLIVNETELHLLASEVTRLNGLSRSADDEVTLARRLIAGSLRTVIVTVGARGAWIVETDSHSLIPAPAVKAVDTTGAGDCFCGVFAAATAQGSPVTYAARVAVSAAAESVQSLGAIASMPHKR